MADARIVGALAIACLLSGTAHAATVTDFFDYGTTGGQLNMGSAADGWSGAWTSSSTNSAAWMLYSPSSSLAFGQSDGTTGVAVGQNIAAMNKRTFSAGMTGTVWISALVQGTAINKEALLFLTNASGGFDSVSAATGFGIRYESGVNSAQAWARYNATVDFDEFGAGTDNVYTPNATYLLLARLTINASGTGDTLDYWIFDSSSASSIPALPATSDELPATPSFSKIGTDIVGNSLTGIGLGATSGMTIDTLRISNDADGFAQVTAPVPEAATLGLLALGGLTLLRRRK